MGETPPKPTLPPSEADIDRLTGRKRHELSPNEAFDHETYVDKEIARLRRKRDGINRRLSQLLNLRVLIRATRGLNSRIKKASQ